MELLVFHPNKVYDRDALLDLVWGKEGSGKSDGFGLAKLQKYHPEVLDNLQEILNDMHVTQRSVNRVQLESDTHQAAVRLTWDSQQKNWLLTAFEKKNSVFDNTTDTDETFEIGKQNDTATLQDTVFESKDTTNSPTTNELGEKSAILSVQEQIQAAEAEVNTSPTEAQKEAGNYKKGHVQIGTFNVTIEQPKGSVRSGVDADGKKWETEMQNTYGYIRGTEGVDGDHIDVFLSDDIDGWDGHKVFVVDQRNADGSFDEHKVMLGFNDINDAEAAYMSNYEEGWQGLGAITGVSIEEFEKWIASSHRKTKAFAEYKSVKTTEGQNASADKDLRRKLADFNVGDVVRDYYNQKLYRIKKHSTNGVSTIAELDAEGNEVGTTTMNAHNNSRYSLAEAPVKAKTPTISQENEQVQPSTPSDNRLVTDERYAELRERMRKKLGGQMNIGIDPEILAIGTEMAVYHLEKGTRKFTEYAKAMIADLGDVIRPYLKAFYNGARNLPGAEQAELEAANEKYNEELLQWDLGELATNEYISVGLPQGILKTYIPNIPIILRQKVLTKSVKRHTLSIEEMMDLPIAISNPIFIFKSNSESVSILTELADSSGKNLFVAIGLETTKQMGHQFLEVNDILTIHGREIENIILPIINNDSLEWVDKNKGLNWLSSAKTNSQAITNQDLYTATKIIENFENPTISDKKSSEEEGIMYRNEEASPLKRYERKTRRPTTQNKVGILENFGNRFIEAYQDNMHSFKVLQESISQSSGKAVKPHEDAYTAENRMSSENKAQAEIYHLFWHENCTKSNEILKL